MDIISIADFFQLQHEYWPVHGHMKANNETFQQTSVNIAKQGQDQLYYFEQSLTIIIFHCKPFFPHNYIVVLIILLLTFLQRSQARKHSIGYTW